MEFTVCLDPGHGGRDSGAVANGIEEKTINLTIARTLKNLLQSAGYKVVMTREDDRHVNLSERVKIANTSQANIFLSIHHNAHSDTSVRGTEVFHYPEENEAAKFAEKTLKSLVQLLGFPSRGVKSAKYGVLSGDNSLDVDLEIFSNTAMPAILTEAGFLTNRHDAEALRKIWTQKNQATALKRGIRTYLGAVETSIPQDHWGADTAERSLQHSIIEGYPDGSLGLDNDVSRIESLTMLWRLYDNVVSTAQLAQRFTPAVATVWNRDSGGLGSGFHLGGGILLTNHHVAEKQEDDGSFTAPNRLAVRFPVNHPDTSDGYTEASYIVGDPRYDLAVGKLYIRPENLADLPRIKIAEKGTIQQGLRVAAVGSPFGLADTFTAGVISNTERVIDYWDPETETKAKLIQIDAAINPGTSGGPALTVNGKLVGVNSAGLSGAQNVGLAIRKDSVREFLEEYDILKYVEEV